MSRLFSYEKRSTIFHKMNGASKLLVVLAWCITAMITFDARYLFVSTVCGFILLRMSKVKFSAIKVIVILMLIAMTLNLILTYVFNPTKGCELYGAETVLFTFGGRYVMTSQQLLYESCILMKHLVLLPLAILLVVTTHPSEFAASLNQIGFSYKVSYAVALTIRYIPDVLREYHDISQSQQARGVELTSKENVFNRIKNAAAILTPLIFSSVERIEVVSNAMELRGFGKNKKRTWYRHQDFHKLDVFVALFALLLVLITVLLFVTNHGRYWNPWA